MKTSSYFIVGKLKSIVVLLCFLIGSKLNATVLQNWTTVEYNMHELTIDKAQKEELWFSFLRMKAGNRMCFQFKNPNNFANTNTFLESKKLSKELSAFFVGKGVPVQDVTIQFSPEAYVMVYKKAGISKNANFISLPLEWLQRFFISNQKGGVCNTKNGHQIVFPPKAFQAVNGDMVTVDVYEIDTKKSFVLSGYTASSNDKLLESNGMFKITTHQENKPVAFKPGIEAEIKYKEEDFKNPAEKSSYSTFYGSEKNSEINWIPNYNQKITSSEKAITLPEASSKFSTYTETFYVQLKRKLPFLESNIASYSKLNEKDFLCLQNKYGALKVESAGGLKEVGNYASYVKLFNNETDDIFIGLSPEQMKKLKSAEQIKLAADIAQREKEEKERKEKEALEAAAQKVFNSHPISMKINQLGNINCDRFPEVQNKTDVIVKLNDTDYDNIRVLTVFVDIKSVIHGTYYPDDKGNITFSDLPEGKNVIYLAAIFKGTQVKMAYISKAIQSKDVVQLTLKSYTEKQYESILNDLIPD